MSTRHRSSGAWHDDNTSDLWDACCHFVSLFLPARSALEADQRRHIIHLPLESTFIHQRPPFQRMAALRTGSGLGERAVTDRWHGRWHGRLDIEDGRGRDQGVRARAMKQVPASLRWLFWCLRFRQGVTRRSRELWAEREKNRRKERDLACVDKHTCCLAKKTLKARWEFLMIVTSQAQTSGLWERRAYQSRTGLEWRQPATPSHSSGFYFPCAWCLCGPALTAARSSGLVFLRSLWVVVTETVGNALWCLHD